MHYVTDKNKENIPRIIGQGEKVKILVAELNRFVRPSILSFYNSHFLVLFTSLKNIS